MISDRAEVLRPVGITAFPALAGFGATLASEALAAGATDDFPIN